MRAVRQFGTAIESLLAEHLAELGLDYEVDESPIAHTRTRPDFVFYPARLAVFVDGCFWHGCLVHGTRPRTNRAWWGVKLEANRQRDERTTRILRRAGWSVLRVWEHQVKQSPRDVATAIAARVKSRLESLRRSRR
jgi:DNA mismatch endonuclease, patch repair protein